MNGNVLATFVVVLVVLGGGWLFFLKPAAPVTQDTQTTPTQTTTTPTPTNTTPTGTTAVHATVTYTDAGFTPSTLTVAAGTVVTFTNNSSHPMWVAADPHPTHQGYDGTTKNAHCVAGYTGTAPFDECSVGNKGGTYTFAFTKAGSWGYHNHLLDQDSGKVIVTGSTSVTGSVNVKM